MAKRSDILTTGQAATFLGVASRTLAEWADAGEVPGSYRLPGKKDRRFPRSAISAFMRKHKMPQPTEWALPPADWLARRVLACLGLLPQEERELLSAGFALASCKTAFDLGRFAQSGAWMVADHSLLCEASLSARNTGLALMIILPEDGSGNHQGWRRWTRRPIDPNRFAADCVAAAMEE